MIGIGLGDLFKLGEVVGGFFNKHRGFHFDKRSDVFTFSWTHSQGRFIQLKTHIRYLVFNKSSVANTLVEVVVESPILGRAEVSVIDDRRFAPLTIEMNHPKEMEFFAVYNVSIEDKNIQATYSLDISFRDQYQKKHTVCEQIPLKDPNPVLCS